MSSAELFSYSNVTDVLDIIATSVLIYYVMLLIRGTRAVQILSGVLVLVLLLAMANLLHLLLLGAFSLAAVPLAPLAAAAALRQALD